MLSKTKTRTAYRIPIRSQGSYEELQNSLGLLRYSTPKPPEHFLSDSAVFVYLDTLSVKLEHGVGDIIIPIDDTQTFFNTMALLRASYNHQNIKTFPVFISLLFLTASLLLQFVPIAFLGKSQQTFAISLGIVSIWIMFVFSYLAIASTAAANGRNFLNFLFKK